MVLFTLEIKVEMEGCTTVETHGITEWPLDLKQPRSDEMRMGVIVSAMNEEKLQDTGGDDTVHFAMRWPDSKKQSSITLVEEMRNSVTADDADAGNWVSIMGFECRGVEPHHWNPVTENEDGLGFEVTGESGDTFTICEWDQSKQNPKEFEWTDYDENSESVMTVRIVDWRFNVIKAKKKGKGKGKGKKKGKK